MRAAKNSPCEEAGDCMTSQVMDPALHTQLGHDGIDKGVPCTALLPHQYESGIIPPGDLLAPWITLQHNMNRLRVTI